MTIATIESFYPDSHSHLGFRGEAGARVFNVEIHEAIVRRKPAILLEKPPTKWSVRCTFHRFTEVFAEVMEFEVPILKKLAPFPIADAA